MYDNERQGISSVLPPGNHVYQDILAGIAEGKYSFAQIATAAGRRFPLIGISSRQLKMLVANARSESFLMCLIGSRVAGPRTHQHKLHPVLPHALPLFSNGRTLSLNHPAVSGIRIEKDTIKEFGEDSPITSDLTIVVIDSLKRTLEDRRRAAASFANGIPSLGCAFPVRVYLELKSTVFDSEEEYLDFAFRHYLKANMNPDIQAKFADPDIRDAFKELYAPVSSKGDTSPRHM